MKLKKILSIALLAISMTTLTACGGGKTSDKGNGGNTSQSSDKLVMAIWDKNQLEGLEKITDDFSKETGIDVEIQVTPWDQYWTMLEAGGSGGELPDIFWMHSNEFSKYAKYDILLDLTDKIKESEKIDLTKYPNEIVDLYKYNGEKQFAVPKDIDTIGLWYNKKMFDEAGIAYPDESWTWDTLREVAKKLTKADGSQYGFTLNPVSTQDGWYNMVYSMGGSILSKDSKTSTMNDKNTIKALNYVTDLIKDGSLPPYEVIAENGADALFTSGKTAMVFQGSWMVNYLTTNEFVQANGDVAVLPKDAITGNRVSIYNGLGWAAAANTSNPDGVWQLIEYLGSKEAQQKQADLGVTMSAYEGTSDNWDNLNKNFNLKAYLDMKENLVIRPHSNNTLAWENYICETLIKVWRGNTSVEDATNTITNRVNELLKEE
ncbi:extracellular solute-binding protein [Clostridium tertium]